MPWCGNTCVSPPYAADEILGVYALAYRECPVYTVAANAVMAGVPKELMPVCVALTQALGNANPQVYRTLLITEPVAADLKKAYADKDDLEADLIAAARRPLYTRVYANYWANTGSVQSEAYTLEQYYGKLMRDPKEQAAQTDTPEWLKGVVKQKQIWTIAAMNKGETAMLLAGDGARNKFMTLPGGGYVTFQIRLPENWDELVAPMGYEPLSHFEMANEQ